METLSSRIISPPPPKSPGPPDDLSTVLTIDYVNGIDFSQYSETKSTLTDNENTVFEAFQKVYRLFSIKPKKNRPLDFNKARESYFFLLQSLNPWKIAAILDVILENTNREQQMLVKLETISFITTHWTQTVRPYLVTLIEHVSLIMGNLKASIQKQSRETMKTLLSSSGNSDLDPFVPEVLKCIDNNQNIEESVERLAGCVFVQNVELPALSVIYPVLEYGLSDNKTEVRRKSCVILTNMIRLVEHPKEIVPLLTFIEPRLERCVDMMSDPEAREVAEKTLSLLRHTVKGRYVAPPTGKDILSSLTTSIDTFNLQKSITSLTITTDNLSVLADYYAAMAASENYVLEMWQSQFYYYLEATLPGEQDKLDPVFQDFFNQYRSNNTTEETIFVDEEPGDNLYQGEFSLAYGSLTLLNNTHLHLKRNRFYGLLGPNNCGKTTLMRAIANEQVDGFPKRDVLKTVFVEHEIVERQVSTDSTGHPIMNTDLCGIDWVVDCCNVVYGLQPPVTRDQVSETMTRIGFGNSRLQTGTDRAADAEMGVTTYSGGWKMKMQLCAATLMNADILMLDEPTGHLDVTNIAWIKQWLGDYQTAGGSIICTSHDSGFLNDMCSHIIDFQKRKLVTFRSQKPVLQHFVEKYPEKQGYFSLKNDVLNFKFPEPVRLESNNNVLLRMTDVTYQYPSRDSPTVTDISLMCSLSSRVSVVGANGAGKSTAIKLLIGELKPSSGKVWKNEGSRIAYVAQHAFQHLEQHLEKTPTEYILWRFAGNDDKESLEFKADVDLNVQRESGKKYFLKTVDILKEIHPCTTPEETRQSVFPEAIHDRRENKKEKTKSYEVNWRGSPNPEDYMWVNREILVAMGALSLVQRFDERLATAAGLMDKPLTTPGVERHLNGFGIEPEQSSHTRIGSLSGGQKVKVVLAASLWQNPHLIILDEPTNYLDRDGLGALTQAIHDFKGGVVIISHNREFADAVSQERWIMEAGRLRREGESTANSDNTTNSKTIQSGEKAKDSWGNEITVKERFDVGDMSAETKASKTKEINRRLRKLRKNAEQNQDEIDDLEEKLMMLSQ